MTFLDLHHYALHRFSFVVNSDQYMDVRVVKAAAKAAKGRAPQLQYPRLALFRQILRAHERHLPAAHRELGDAYVREEFRAHRKASVRRARLPRHTSR